VGGGDVARGRATINKTCVVCHGAGAVGTDRGPRVATSKRGASYIAQRIRTSGPRNSDTYLQLTGGVMPFWTEDRLDDDELRDIVAFLRDVPGDAAVTPADSGIEAGVADAAARDAEAADAGAAPDTSPPSPDAGTIARDAAADTADAKPPASGCGKTHPRVGWKADLGINTGEGQVSGFVTMVDDCTLELSDFSYDGNGIDVRVFGSKVKTFRPGFAMGPNLVNRRFMKQKLTVQLPAGKTLDDLDWVSIWCTKARADFGSGPFLAP
jgi:cytochrome c553